MSTEEVTEEVIEEFVEEFAEDMEISAEAVQGELTDSVETTAAVEAIADSELEAFESAEIEELEFVDEDRLMSIVESILFATDKPQSLAAIKQAFKGTSVKSSQLRRALDQLAVEYAGGQRGVFLEEASGGYQLRTKPDNMDYLRRMVKARPFKLSGPALEVLSIVAYKQPCVKHVIDEIRGVESGHLLRALMEKGLVSFAGKSELPGKPMLYATSKKFLEIFSLRNLKELPSLSEIDELIPEGIGEEDEDKESLGDLTDNLSQEVLSTYSQGEEELERITDQLTHITTTSDFFEQEKQRQKEKRDAERAQDISEALALGDEVAEKDQRWLERYQAEQAARQAEAAMDVSGDQDPSQGIAAEPAAEPQVDEAVEAVPIAAKGDESEKSAQSEQEEALRRVDFAQLERDLKVFDEG